MLKRICVLKAIGIISCLHISTIHAVFRVHNKTDATLYMAAYHAGDKGIRQSEVVEIRSERIATLAVAPTKTFSTKKRYIAIARSKDDLTGNITLQSLKALPHVNIKSEVDADYYLVDKE